MTAFPPLAPDVPRGTVDRCAEPDMISTTVKRINKRPGSENMQVLLYAAGALVVIWIVVLVGSPFFGPGNH